eukprot:1442140-Amphidinium_carterae.2
MSDFRNSCWQQALWCAWPPEAQKDCTCLSTSPSTWNKWGRYSSCCQLVSFVGFEQPVELVEETQIDNAPTSTERKNSNGPQKDWCITWPFFDLVSSQGEETQVDKRHQCPQWGKSMLPESFSYIHKVLDTQARWQLSSQGSTRGRPQGTGKIPVWPPLL